MGCIGSANSRTGDFFIPFLQGVKVFCNILGKKDRLKLEIVIIERDIKNVDSACWSEWEKKTSNCCNGNLLIETKRPQKLKADEDHFEQTGRSQQGTGEGNRSGMPRGTPKKGAGVSLQGLEQGSDPVRFEMLRREFLSPISISSMGEN